VWATFAVLGVLLCAYLVFLLTRTDWTFSPWLDGWLVIAFEAAASGLCLSRAIGKRRHWQVALIMGCACLSWTLGDVVLTIETLGLHGAQSVPVPSLADLFYLGFFPTALVAILLYTRGEIDRGAQPNWLDGAIAALGMAALCSGVAFHGLEKLFEGASLASATTLAYPVGDLLLLGLVAGSSVVVEGRARATLVLLAVGMAINAAGDTFNFLNNTSTAGQIVNGVAWPTSILVFAMSMWVGDGTSNRLTMRSLSGFVLPGFVTLSSLVILVIGNVTKLGPVAVALATVTLILTGIRLAYRPALREARERLRSSEDRYQMLFEHNPQPMAAYDRNTLEIVAVNDAMVQKYGFSMTEFESMHVTDLLPDEERAKLRRFLSEHPGGVRVEDAKDPEWTELRHHRTRDGEIIDIEVTSNNVELDGRECRIAIYLDVTERNRTARELAVARDRAVEASNMKSAFLANMSHEIRTPMNGVIGMNDLLLTGELSSEQRGYAEQVARSGEQMLALINDILDIAKLETGHIELDLGDFHLHETLEQTCSVVALQAREKGLHFELEVEPDVPARARGDARRLQQVLLNLVSNAVKFTAEGAVSVRVSATRRGKHGTRLAVAVADTGIGIDSSGLERMFEPFTQADVSTTRIYGGTGLGLAIVRELVELMGGTIRAESEPGEGSVFWFEIDLDAPLAVAPAEAPTGNGSSSPGGAPAWLTQPLVLVAEDSPVNQIVAARALERCGCRAEVVADGREALRALEGQRYDAVLMDCQMPVLDGYEATAELRRREGDGRRTPVIAMTAHAMEGDRERCLAAGMDDYVSKPMRHGDLAAALMRWIAQEEPGTASGNGRGKAPRRVTA
jgi:PAS domain S-box-containing protein